MFLFHSSKKEPPLHKAIIDNDLARVRRLGAHTKFPDVKNPLGFDPLETAHLLGRKECVKILDPKDKRTIKVLEKNERIPLKLNEKQFRDHFGVEYCSHLFFPDYAFFKETLANCPWILKKSVLGEDNREQAWIFRQELYNGYRADMTIQWINEDLGYGAFTNVPLKAGDFVGEFTGRVRRLLRRKPDQNEYCFHYPTKFWSWKYTVIDASKEGNEIRFINHSNRPNLSPICLCERSLLHIVFVAKNDIQPGTQLTYDYGKDFWQRRQQIPI